MNDPENNILLLPLLFLVVHFFIIFYESQVVSLILLYFIVSLFIESRERDQSRRHTPLAISVQVNCFVDFYAMRENPYLVIYLFYKVFLTVSF